MSFRKHTFPYQVHFSNPISFLYLFLFQLLLPPLLLILNLFQAPLALPFLFKTTRVLFLLPPFLLQILLLLLYHLPFLPLLPLLFLSALLLVLITLPFGCRTLSLHFLLPLPLILISCFLLYIIGVFLPNFCPSESLPLMQRPPFPLIGLRPCKPSSKPLHLIIPGISPISLPGNILLAASGFTRPSYVMMVLLNALKPI